MEKPMINLIFAGHVDHGKSTLVGRLFYELGKIPGQKLERLKRHAESVGKSTFFYAFFMDKTLEERQRGISVEVSFEGFETGERRFNIIDAPGHKDFVKNMITGTSEADAGVLVVDVKVTSEKGLQPQTKEHIILLHSLGIEQLLIVLNKMDTVNYSKDVFDYVKLEVEDFLEQGGYKFQNSLIYVPVSAYLGENITKHSENMEWYNSSTLLDALNSLQPPVRLINKPFRMPILRTFSVSGVGTVVAGRIESGVIKYGDRVVITPYPGKGVVSGEVKTIEWQHKRLEKGVPGEDVGILLTHLSKGFVARNIKKGFMVGSLDDPPREVEKFKAKMIVIDYPSQIRIGYSPYLHCHQAAIPCSIVGIEDVFDPKTGKSKEKNTEYLINGNEATVWIKPLKPLVIEEVNKISRLSRFVLRDGRTVGVGVCIKIIPKEVE